MLRSHQLLGDFEIIRLLGKGGMGEVYEAEQQNPRRRVALKVLAPWLTEDEDALQRFWREAEVPARLDHPNIVRIISTGKTPEGIAFYTMHLVQGIPLSELIRRASLPSSQTVEQATAPADNTPSDAMAKPNSPPVPDTPAPALLEQYREDRFRLTARIGAVAARALAFAHDKGVLHRDIKPSNLMVDHHDHLYVVDFGLTRALSADAMGSSLGTVRGTPWYMSPEQAEGQPLDERSDIYSLGVTLYELLTRGVGPFTASRSNAAGVMAQVRDGQVLPLRVLAPDVPAELERIVSRAMHFKPQRRYSSAAELAADLEAFLQKAPGVASRPKPGRARLPRQSRLIAIAAVALVLIGVVVTVAYFFRPSGGGSPPTTEQATTPTEFPAGYPELLRNRERDVPLPLVKSHYEPLWPEKLFGRGGYTAQSDRLALYADMKSEYPCMLRLDNDPLRRWFEFKAKLLPVANALPGESELGLFFGWPERLALGDPVPHFFVVQLDPSPAANAPHGQLTLAAARIVKRNEGVKTDFEWFDPIQSCPLPQQQSVYLVSVRALHDAIAVSVDGSPLIQVDLPELRKAKPQAARLIDPRGALGVWARKGLGEFSDLTITALRPARE